MSDQTWQPPQSIEALVYVACFEASKSQPAVSAASLAAFNSSICGQTGRMFGSLANSRSSILAATTSAPLRAGDAREQQQQQRVAIVLYGAHRACSWRQLCCRPRVGASSGMQADYTPATRAEAALPHP